jgi:hypothetical protein
MGTIFKIFQELKNRPAPHSDCFNVASLPSVKHHKIGISHKEHLVFFIKCSDSNSVKSIDCNLEYISVEFSRSCQLKTNKKEIEKGIYTIISLKTTYIDLQEYFFDVVYLIIKRLPENPTVRELKTEVEKLLNLFSKFSQPAIKTIQGLWAELLIIEQSSNPDYLINAWHSCARDKFDFNDGLDKIEIKSTSKTKRIHNFSIEQLNPNENSQLIIVSVFTVETGIGESVFSLVDLIQRKLNNFESSFRINEIIAQTLGKDFEKAFNVFYDYQLAKDSIAYFDRFDIPSINVNDIPKNVNNVRFDSDLSDLPNLKRIKTKSILHKSLFHK